MIPYLLQRGWGHEDYIRHQVRALQDFEGLWVKVEDTDLLAVDDGSDGSEASAIVSLLVLAVLNKLPGKDVLLEGEPGYEVVIRPVQLLLPPGLHGEGGEGGQG